MGVFHLISTQQTPVLGSKWDGMNEHLLARIFLGEKGDAGWGRSTIDRTTVVCPLIDPQMEIVQNWQSPFEQAGVDAQAPFFAAMLQTGGFLPVLDKISDLAKQVGAEATSGLSDYARQGIGRSSITKLNSTQVFTGMPPIKITTTLLFRAWNDSTAEVERPVDQLMSWVLPEEISGDASLVLRLAEATTANDKGAMLKAMFPSKAPPIVGLTYKNRTWLPLVIESISLPIGSPIDAQGRFTELAVQATFCTLTALDRADWSSSRTVIM